MSQISFWDLLYCEVCLLKFDNMYDRRQHLALVHGEEIKVKKESMIKEENFEQLKQSEKQFEKPYYKCHYPIIFDFGHFLNCSAAFPTKSQLNRHVTLVHEGKKKPLLKEHMKSVHEGKKAFQCNICDASFARKGHLNTHVASVHEGKKPFQCNICDASFAKKQHLNTHVASIHEKTNLE